MLPFPIPADDPLVLVSVLVVILLIIEVAGRMAGLLRIPLGIAAGVLVSSLGFDLTPGAGIMGLIGAGLWFSLGIGSSALLPKKRVAATFSFALLDTLFTLGLVMVAGLVLNWAWEASLILGLGAAMRARVPLSEGEMENLGANRLVQLVTSAGAVSRLTVGLVGAVLLSWHMGAGILQALGSLVLVAGIWFIIPPILRPLLQHFSEESPALTLVPLLLSLGAGLFGAVMLGWPVWAGLLLGAFSSGRVLPAVSVMRNRLSDLSRFPLGPLGALFLGAALGSQVFLQAQTWIAGGLALVAVLGAPFIVSGILKVWYAYGSWETSFAAGLSLAHGPSAVALFLVLPPLLGPEADSVLGAGAVLLAGTSLAGPMAVRFLLKFQTKKGTAEGDGLESSGRRIMVSLANPDTASHLVDLALGLHTRDNAEALYPVIVVQEGPDSERAVLHAERMLTGAMGRAVALGKSVVPVTSLDMNISSGIVRVSKARRIGLLILGWNGQFGVQRSIFGSVLDQTVKNSPLEIFVLKASGTLVGVPRVVVGIPPLVDQQAGFDQALRDLMTLGESLGAKFVFTGLKESLSRVQDSLQRWKVSRDMSFEVLEDWKRLADRWKGQCDSRDLLVLFSLRQSQMAWQPLLDRLPKIITQQFPSQSLLVVYPGAGPELRRDEPEDNSSILRQTAEDLPKVLLNLGNLSLDEALIHLLKIDFTGETLEKTGLLVGEIARTQPVELKPGVLLVHTHLNIVDDFSVYWGVNPQGWNHEGLTGGVKVVVLLLSPLAEGPEMHLRKLSELARLIGKTDWTDRLLKAKNRDELVEKLPDYKV